MLPSACGLGQHFQDLGHSFSLYGPPSRQITYKFEHVKICCRAKAHMVFHCSLNNKGFYKEQSVGVLIEFDL